MKTFRILGTACAMSACFATQSLAQSLQINDLGYFERQGVIDIINKCHYEDTKGNIS